MPPTQPLLNSGIRGYVCKSCLLRSQRPQRPRASWLTRKFTSGIGVSVRLSPFKPSSNAGPDTHDTKVRFFEQGPDGERREVQEDPTEEMLRNTVETTIRKNLEDALGENLDGLSMDEIGKKLGMTKAEWEAGMNDFNGALEQEDFGGGRAKPWSTEDFENSVRSSDFDGNVSHEYFMSQLSEGERQEHKEQETIVSRITRLMDKYEDKEDFTEDEVELLRKELLQGMTDEDRVRSELGLEDKPRSRVVRRPIEALSSPHPTLDLQKQIELASDIEGTSIEGDEDMPDMDENSTAMEELEPDSETSIVTIPRERFPQAYKKRISALNNSLRRAARLLEDNKLGDNIQKDSWKSYLLCSKALLQSPENIPRNVWNLLWDIFEKPNEKNYGRFEHLFRLGNDMKQAGVGFSSRQFLEYVEARFSEGDQKAAIKDWESAQATLGTTEPTFKRYWLLGIRLYGETGNASKALDAVGQFLTKSNNAADYRILIPVIRAYLAVDKLGSLRTAWAAYELLKRHLGPLMRMEDYDAVAALFLEANHSDRALQVFTDMMQSGDKLTNTKKFGPLTPKDVKKLASVGNVAVEESQSFATLPSSLNNKFFFGKWIKKLIGDGDLVNAKRVFDLMRDRGIRADAKHMNGLIGALYRSKITNDHFLGTEIGWQMIASRIDFVKQRNSTYQIPKGFLFLKTQEKQAHKSPLLVPRATIETFSILLEQYRRAHSKEDITRLYAALSEAQILPDTYFMNQMILNNWRFHDTKWTFSVYSGLLERGVQPDFDTYKYLWDIMRKATDPMTKKDFVMTSCHELFRHMSSRATGLCKKEAMPREVYDAIILAFSLSDDQAGTAVALRALQKYFNMYPSAETARTVVLQLTKAGMLEVKRDGGERAQAANWGHRPRQLKLRRRATQERVHEVTKVFATFKKQRIADLLERGIVFEEMDEAAKAEESLILLTDLLRYVCQSRSMGSQHAKPATAKSRDAAERMGVPDCNPWINPEEPVYEGV